MASFIVYKPLSNKELKEMAEKAIKGITKFFKENPRRRICNVELWYGRQVKVRKNHIEEDIQKALEKALK